MFVMNLLKNCRLKLFQSFASADHVEKTVSPDELVQVTRRITMATTKAVAAGNSGQQEDIIAAANMGRKAISDLVRACKVSVTFPCM